MLADFSSFMTTPCINLILSVFNWLIFLSLIFLPSWTFILGFINKTSQLFCFRTTHKSIIKSLIYIIKVQSYFQIYSHSNWPLQLVWLLVHPIHPIHQITNSLSQLRPAQIQTTEVGFINTFWFSLPVCLPVFCTRMTALFDLTFWNPAYLHSISQLFEDILILC